VKYALISGSKSKALRRIVTSTIPNYDFTVHLGHGEQINIVDQIQPLIIDDAHPLIIDPNDTIVAPLESAVVDEALVVVALIKANPEIDTSPDGQLILSYPGVFVGCTYDAANDWFVAPIVDVPGGVSPDGAPYPPFQVGGPIPRPPA
jgi:hypothetical protein